MDNNRTRALMLARLNPRLERLGLSADDLADELDLVRSGLLDSLGFVDLIADLEDATGKQVDLERALDARDGTTVSGVIRLFT